MTQHPTANNVVADISPDCVMHEDKMLLKVRKKLQLAEDNDLSESVPVEMATCDNLRTEHKDLENDRGEGTFQ